MELFGPLAICYWPHAYAGWAMFEGPYGHYWGIGAPGMGGCALITGIRAFVNIVRLLV